MHRLLRTSRSLYRNFDDQLSEMRAWSEADRVLLRPVIRAYAVQVAAADLSPWWMAYNALRLVTAIIVIALPGALIVAWSVDQPTGLCAAVTYVVAGGAVAIGYGVQEELYRARYIWVGVAAVAAGGVAAIALPDAPWLGRGIGVGVAASVLLGLLIIGRLAALVFVRSRVFTSLVRRRAGWPMPPQYAAVRLIFLLQFLEEHRGRARHPRFRGFVLRVMNEDIASQEWDVVNSTASLRLGYAVTADVRARVARLAGHLRGLHARLAHDDGHHEFDLVLDELATLVRDLVRGDWSSSETPVEGLPARPGVWVRFGRRIVPAVVLVAAAVALPFTPGVTGDAPAVTGVQVGLVLAAALSLLPVSVDTAHRDRVLAAFTDVTKTDG